MYLLEAPPRWSYGLQFTYTKTIGIRVLLQIDSGLQSALSLPLPLTQTSVYCEFSPRPVLLFETK